MQKLETLTVSKMDEKTNLALVQASLNKDWKAVDQNTRVRFVSRLCEQLKISPVLNPFRFIDMKGVTVLYAPAAATALIANANRISQEILKEVYDKEKQILKIYIRSSQPDGRFTDEYASLYLGSNAGEVRANLEMKCLTKAKRRGVLALVNMSIPDEDEAEYLESASLKNNATSIPYSKTSQLQDSVSEKKEPVDVVEKEDVDSARMELMDLVTKGESKKMEVLKKFIADHTEGKNLAELTYDECHSLIAEIESYKKPEQSEDNYDPEVQPELL